ncbi:hypothetical protein [Lapidilactobacillus wuchangensis]|jgi:hypothetical protein|uniref:hypothetical protein n=1 Tax=Lapidilactobacillus wuchangensis TaxID=2486001 RepID=UPI0013DDE3A9|nr:hypothetical protein [Lapidilactobacillus wuchangensis]
MDTSDLNVIAKNQTKLAKATLTAMLICLQPTDTMSVRSVRRNESKKRKEN